MATICLTTRQRSTWSTPLARSSWCTRTARHQKTSSPTCVSCAERSVRPGLARQALSAHQLLWLDEAIAAAALGFNVFRAAWMSQLGAQTADKHFQVLGAGVIIRAPNTIEQCL